MAEIELLHDLRDRFWTPEQWRTIPVAFNKRGEVRSSSAPLQWLNECSGEIILATKAG